MKIQIRTLNQIKYEIEVPSAETTIEQLKSLIEEKYQHNIAHQVLIFLGKILSNDVTISSCNIKDNDFLVLMIKKPKGAPGTAPTTSTPVTSITASIPSTTTTTVTATEPPPRNTISEPKPIPVSSTTAAIIQERRTETQPITNNNTEAATAANLYSQSASTFLTGDELKSVVDNIVSMGFPRERVLSALRASFGNPDRALEYLLNPIPDVSQQPGRTFSSSAMNLSEPHTGGGGGGGDGGGGGGGGVPPPPPSQIPARSATPPVYTTAGIELPANIIPPSLLQQQPPAQVPGGSESGGGGVNAGGGVFDILRNHPSLPQLRHIAHTDPDRLQEIISQLVQQRPSLLPLIEQHQDEFVELLRGDNGGGGGSGEGGSHLPITPQDQEAINRLVGLGFPRDVAEETYFLLGKDENLAASYLFSYGNDAEMEFEEDDDDEGDFPDE